MSMNLLLTCCYLLLLTWLMTGLPDAAACDRPLRQRASCQAAARPKVWSQRPCAGMPLHSVFTNHYHFNTLVEKSAGCVCFQTITLERNDLSPWYVACWFVLILSKSDLTVKVIFPRMNKCSQLVEKWKWSWEKPVTAPWLKSRYKLETIDK